MSKLFIIRNQHGHYLSKQQEWLDGGDRTQLYRTVHRDEAINTVFEQSSRDIHLRAEVLACDADARGNPQLGDGAVSARELEADSARDGDTPDQSDADAPVEAMVETEATAVGDEGETA